jgi:hypothetical protein
MKDEKFGHRVVFREVEQIMKGTPVSWRAFPIDLILPAEKKEDGQAGSACQADRCHQLLFNGFIFSY